MTSTIRILFLLRVLDKIMNSVTGILFRRYLLFFAMAMSCDCVSRCSLEPEIHQTSNVYWKNNLTHSWLLFDSNSEFKKSQASLVEKGKCPVNDSCMRQPWLAGLMSLLDELEDNSECTFDETEWRWSVKNSMGPAQAKRITSKNDPSVYVIPNFLTPRQCQDLVDLHEEVSRSSGNKRWQFSTTKQLLSAVYRASLSPDEYNISVDSSTDCDGVTLEGVGVGERLANVLNVSSSVLIPRGEDAVVDLIEKQIQQTLGLPRTNAYHAQLVKYQANSEYKAHTDCHGVENDRMATIIIYLTDVDEGGETNFPFLNKSIKPKRGMAVVWKNLDSDGKCDIKTTHVASRVYKGEKYIYQKWFYENPILAQYLYSDYVFCDLSQSCRHYIYNKSTTMAVQYIEKGHESSNYKDALKYYEQALHYQPLHSAALILYADALNVLGHSHEALPYLFSLLKMHPRNEDGIEILRSVLETLEASNSVCKVF